MQDTQFRISIPNLPQLQEALASYPSIAAPIVQKAIVACNAILAKFTTAANVPVRSGYLLQNWAWEIGTLQGRWYPKAEYAPYVEFGTGPHIIRAKSAKVLANPQTGEIFGTIVHHPGTKANPFMERIVASAQPEVENIFMTALDQITGQIASTANA